tara:strand:+ start:415 stop:639 length:225 start_codon:yes stop_codon:yes gene_type:complete
VYIRVLIKEIKKGIKMNEIFEEIKRDMDEFFTEIDKAIGRDPEEVDVITDHLPDPMDDDEAEYWEMKAEIHNGI